MSFHSELSQNRVSRW